MEDDEDLRRELARLLRRQGYAVIEASDGKSASQVLRSSSAIDLLFTDFMLPEGPYGTTLIVEARRLRPGIAVMLTSAHAEADVLGTIPTRERPIFLQKPYKRQTLFQSLAAFLGTKPQATAPSD